MHGANDLNQDYSYFLRRFVLIRLYQIRLFPPLHWDHFQTSCFCLQSTSLCTKLGGQIFDSGPGYLDTSTGLKGIRDSSLNIVVSWAMQSVFLAAVFVDWLTATIKGIPVRHVEYWDHLCESNAVTASPALCLQLR